MSSNNDFEKTLAELEDIVNQLENNSCSLDESMKLFERGVELSALCRKTLENARQKIVTLTENGEDNDSQ